MRTETTQWRTSGQPHRSAFTLVELLVVIGIIAVLMSILMPALSRSRMQAARVVCATQMRELVNATVMYCNDNKGHLPDFRGYHKDIAMSTMIQDDSNFCAMGSSSVPAFPDLEANNPNFRDGAGLGKLFVHKYINNYKILTCPNLDSTILLNGSKRPAYFFNPHWAYALPAAATRTPRYKKIKDIPRDRCLIHEFFYNEGSIAHHEPREESAYFNLAFSDGHVATVKNKTARDRAAIAGWEPGRGADVIGITEFVDSGKPLDKTLGKAHDEAMMTKVYYSFWPMVPN